MQKYSTKIERETIRTLLLSNDMENIELGLSLLENLPRYKYFKNKILYKYKALHFRVNKFNPIGPADLSRDIYHEFKDYFKHYMYHTNAKKSTEDLIKKAREGLKKSRPGYALDILAKALKKYERVF